MTLGKWAERADVLLPREERMIKAHSDDPIQKYKWDMRLAIRPHICVMSRERIPMFTYAYQGIRKIYGPGTPVIMYKWLTKHEYLMLKIKGSL